MLFIRKNTGVAFALFFAVLCVGLCVLPAAGNVFAAANSGERASVIAGTWYPGDSAALKAQIKSFLSQARTDGPEGQIMGMVVPHAGYVYSGPVAAFGYNLLQKQQFDTVVVIGPSHRAAFEYVSVYDQGGYRTPLGLAELDMEFITALKKNDPRLQYVTKAHEEEHSVEIQLPFLQIVQPRCRIVPLVMGAQNIATCRALAAALAETIRGFAGKKRVLLVASSDLSHYYDTATAAKKDGLIVDALNQLSPESLLQCLASRSCEACGGGPILAMLQACLQLGADKGVVLKHGDSGETSGDTQRVVGYLSAVIMKTKSEDGEQDPPEATQRVGQADRKQLHAIARQAIKARLDGKPHALPATQSALLKAPGAAFVTLKKHGQLRGCIGHIIAREPLAQTVAEMAVAAAFNDPRFPPLKKAEYADLDYEISVLSPLQRISDPEQVRVGTHGLLMRQGGFSGLLLPQVPVEYGWNREMFLRNTCRKAGLPMDCWKDKTTEIYVFSAEVF